MKQNEFAKAVGTSRETVSHWENLNEKGEPRQRTTRTSAAAIARLARERLGWDVDASFYQRDDETPWNQVSKQLKDLDSKLDKIRERLTARNPGAAAFTGGSSVAHRFLVGDIVALRDPANGIGENGVALAVEDVTTLSLDFYCDPCDAHWSIPDPHGYWRARIADEGDFPHCPSQESPDCDPRHIRSYTTAVHASQSVTVDFGGRMGGPAEFSGDHLRLILREG